MLSRVLLTSSLIFAGALALAPAATAAPGTWVNTTSVVDGINARLAGTGIVLDRGGALAFDADADALLSGAPAAEFAEPAPLSEQAPPAEQALPNYTVRTDLPAQIMAATPGEVLHRVPGSWFNAPGVPEESRIVEEQGRSLYGPGTPIYLGGEYLCTLAVTGTDSDGRLIGITAGHCGQPGDAVRSADSYWTGDSGTVVATGATDDYAVIEFGSNAQLSGSYNGITVDAVGGGVATGQEVCKQGVGSGFTCGPVWTADERSTMSQVCAGLGDSGAPVLVGNRVVGIVSGGSVPNYALSCTTPLQGVLHMPTVSVNMDRILEDMDNSAGPGRGFQPTR